MNRPIRTRLWTGAPTSRHRTVHLCDIENLAGSGQPTTYELDRSRSAYIAAAEPGPADLVIVGCDRGSLANAGVVWGNTVRFVIGAGPDGADNALLAALPIAHAASRFDRIVIGSGDGRAFVPYVNAARNAGLTVVVVAARASCSRALLFAADAVNWVPDNEPMTVAA